MGGWRCHGVARGGSRKCDRRHSRAVSRGLRAHLGTSRAACDGFAPWQCQGGRRQIGHFVRNHVAHVAAAAGHCRQHQSRLHHASDVPARTCGHAAGGAGQVRLREESAVYGRPVGAGRRAATSEQHATARRYGIRFGDGAAGADRWQRSHQSAHVGQTRGAGVHSLASGRVGRGSGGAVAGGTNFRRRGRSTHGSIDEAAYQADCRGRTAAQARPGRRWWWWWRWWHSVVAGVE